MELNILKSPNPLINELMDLQRRIVDIQNSYIPGIKPPLHINREYVGYKIKSGEYILKNQVIHIDTNLFTEIYSQIADVASQNNFFHGKTHNPESSALANSENQFPVIPEEISAQSRDILIDFIRNYQIDNALKSFIFYCSITPFYKSCIQALEFRDEIEIWQRGNCPFCGSSPAMAKLIEDTGERILMCSLCECEWSFPRIKCPFCGNQNNKTLDYFYIEEDRGHRVDVCRECLRYLKTCDERILQRKVIFIFEDIITYPLDLLAEEEGFTT